MLCLVSLSVKLSCLPDSLFFVLYPNKDVTHGKKRAKSFKNSSKFNFICSLLFLLCCCIQNWDVCLQVVSNFKNRYSAKLFTHNFFFQVSSILFRMHFQSKMHVTAAWCSSICITITKGYNTNVIGVCYVLFLGWYAVISLALFTYQLTKSF